MRWEASPLALAQAGEALITADALAHAPSGPTVRLPSSASSSASARSRPLRLTSSWPRPRPVQGTAAGGAERLARGEPWRLLPPAWCRAGGPTASPSPARGRAEPPWLHPPPPPGPHRQRPTNCLLACHPSHVRQPEPEAQTGLETEQATAHSPSRRCRPAAASSGLRSSWSSAASTSVGCQLTSSPARGGGLGPAGSASGWPQALGRQQSLLGVLGASAPTRGWPNAAIRISSISPASTGSTSPKGALHDLVQAASRRIIGLASGAVNKCGTHGCTASSLGAKHHCAEHPECILSSIRARPGRPLGALPGYVSGGRDPENPVTSSPPPTVPSTCPAARCQVAEKKAAPQAPLPHHADQLVADRGLSRCAPLRGGYHRRRLRRAHNADQLQVPNIPRRR